MSQKTVKVFLASGVGAFVGSLLALQLSSHVWWLGLCAGFLVGYLSFESRKVAAAIPTAWRAAMAWKSDLWPVRAFFRLVVPSASVAATITVGIFVWDEIRRGRFELWPELWLAILLVFAFAMVWALVTCACWVRCSQGESRRDQRLAQWEHNMLRANPFRVYLWVIPKWILYTLPMGIAKAIFAGAVWLKRIGLPVTLRFCRELFYLIHSEERLLCGVDAAVGAAVGYFAGRALIGMIAGGIIGVVEFEWVSKRILKVIPLGH